MVEKCVACGTVCNLLHHSCVVNGLRYSYSRGIDEPGIRRTLPIWQRILYKLGFYGFPT